MGNTTSDKVQDTVDLLTGLGMDDGTNETIPLPPDILYGNITENAQPLLDEEVDAWLDFSEETDITGKTIH